MSRDNERLQRPPRSSRAAAGDLAALAGRAVAQQPIVGGRLCLDFVNTTGGWEPGERGASWVPRDDRLTAWPDLVAWARRVGVVDDARALRLLQGAAPRERETRQVMARAHALRHAIYRTVRRLTGGARPLDADARVLQDEVRASRQRERLVPADGGLVWTRDEDGDALDGILSQVTQSAVETLTTGDPSRLRVCPGEECGWLFEDTSRNRSRRWCRMADCGNLDKVRRFRTKPG